jgi:hypothetical protein
MSDVTNQKVLDRLSHVEKLLADARTLDSVQVRCGAWLLRTTVERAVMTLYGNREGSRRSMHALLLGLPKYVDDDVAQDTSQLWHALCRAAHHHDYEIAPTVDELRTWHAETVHLTGLLLTHRLPRPRNEDSVRRHG